MDGFWQAVKVIAVTVVVVAAAGWTARQTATRMRFAGRGRHLAIVDSISLGLQRGVFLVRLADRYVVIGLARDNITLLSELGPEALSGEAPTPDGPESSVPGGNRYQPGPSVDDPAAVRMAARLESLWAKLSGDERHADGRHGDGPRRSHRR